MIVTKDIYQEVLDELQTEIVLAIDCETTGLRPYHGDKIIGISISSETKDYYFNFNENDVDPNASILPRELIKNFNDVFRDTFLYVLANAKFDMHFLHKENVYLPNPVYDVLVMARVERNDHIKYSLDECAKRIGLEKSDAVKAYLLKHRLYKKVSIPGKKKQFNEYRWDLVPECIMAPYAMQDTRVTFSLYKHQQTIFKNWESQTGKIKDLVRLEMKTTKVCFDMEKRGLLLDAEYCEKVRDLEAVKIKSIEEKAFQLTGQKLVDSNKNLKDLLKPFGYENESVDEESLKSAKIENETFNTIRDLILEYRKHRKKLNSYFSSFLYFKDEENVIHANYRQSATKTSRFSISDPALQTLKKSGDVVESIALEDEAGIRDCFIAPKGFSILDIDYKNMEYRAAIDVSFEKEMATKISNGFDPHQAAADLASVSRKEAKTVMFAKLYGAGTKKISEQLGQTEPYTKEVVSKLFGSLKKLNDVINNVSYVATSRGFILNLFGRRYWYDGSDKEKAYKAFNAWNQGSCADAVKKAMVDLHDFLKPYETKMVLQVHDSIVFYLKDGEEFLIPKIKEIMISAYPSKILKMDCSVEIGPNWGSLKPYEERNIVS